MIGVFAGTTEGKKIISELLINKKKVVAFVATEYGGSLIENHDNLTLYSKPMNKDELKEHLIKHSINKIIDATHPYAVVISKNLIDICEEFNLTYYRFERELSNLEEVEEFDNYEDIIVALKETTGNILLSIGSNNLDVFTNEINHNRLYVRVLPTKRVLERCEFLGLKANNIIAMQGPFSLEMNKVMMRDLEIKYLVTKNSGTTGGIMEKITAANSVGVKVMVLKIPEIDYPQKFVNINTLINQVL